MSLLVYYSSATGNTHRFVQSLGLPALRIPVSAAQPMPLIDAPYVLVCPTYCDGQGHGTLAEQVICFLNDPARRALLRGVIAGGNRNFGRYFAHAGKHIASKCGVPVLHRFELAGTEADVDLVRNGLNNFWRTPCLVST